METLEDSAPANVWLGDPLEGVDLGAVEIAAAEQAARPVAGVDDMASYLATQVGDASHRDVLGPLLDGAGPSGVVVRRGTVLASWGDPTRVEMAFSVTKSVLSLVAGIAHDDGLLHLDEPVTRRVDLPQLANPHGHLVTWRHLLDQTSQWEGELWGKPTSVDVQSTREGTESAGGLPGAGWAYNDVRVNLAALALTTLLRRSLANVLRERILDPIGASTSWSWHGYPSSRITLDDADDPDDPDDADGADEALTPVVSGGAHWGGGLWISALDLARIGHLCLRRGTRGHGQVLSSTWIDQLWTPCPVKATYGLSWWLNDDRTVWSTAAATGRCARGNGGRHLLWVDPARDLVVTSHWGNDVEQLLHALTNAVNPTPGRNQRQ
jgi:CubicO group peptidase (beta-lactamase class C family)